MSMETKILSPKQTRNSDNSVLRSHFDRAADLLEQKAALAADIAEWRDWPAADAPTKPKNDDGLAIPDYAP